MKYILKGDRQKLEKVVGKAVEDVFKDYNVTYIGNCVKTVTPMGELYINAKCYEEVFIECIEEKIASYELRNMMTHKTIYHQTDGLGQDYFNELITDVKNIKHLHNEIRSLEQQSEFLDFHVVDIKSL